MTDKPLHHFRNPGGVAFSTQSPSAYTSDCEPIIPIPAALVDDMTVDAVDWAAGMARRDEWPATEEALTALRDALIAGRPEPEPLPEPTDLAARVLDKSNDEWVQRSDGLWIRITTGLCFYSWKQLTSTFGPLRLADGGDSDD